MMYLESFEESFHHFEEPKAVEAVQQTRNHQPENTQQVGNSEKIKIIN